MSYQYKNMLITGGAGFIGANFIQYLFQHKAVEKVINLDKLTYAGNVTHLKNLQGNPQYEFVQGDIVDSDLVRTILQQYRIETIVHFAAESHVDRSILGPKTFIETNVLGTLALLESARHYWLEKEKWHAQQCRFHHISTDEVYGSLDLNAPAFTEQTPYAPRSPYAASKASSDHLVQAYHHTYGLPITISNCSNNYGRYQHPEKFIPTIIRACLNNTPIPIYGNGKNIRDWLYVEDHCRGIDLILKQGKIGEHYNLGGNQEIENLTLAKLICAKMDTLFPLKFPHEKLLSYVPDRLGHDFRYAIHAQKILQQLGWSPRVDFKHGMDATIEYYCQSEYAKESDAVPV